MNLALFLSGSLPYVDIESQERFEKEAADYVSQALRISREQFLEELPRLMEVNQVMPPGVDTTDLFSILQDTLFLAKKTGRKARIVGSLTPERLRFSFFTENLVGTCRSKIPFRLLGSNS